MKTIIFWRLCAFMVISNSTDVSTFLLDSKINMGSNVQAGIADFLVSLKRNKVHFCSGCLISRKDILTTAQCIHKFKMYADRLNVWEVAAYLNETKYEIEFMKTHPDYDKNKIAMTSVYDLGLIELRISLDLNSNLSSTLDLISIPVAADFILPGKTASIFSYSLVSNDIKTKRGQKLGPLINAVQKMEVLIEDNETCEKIINKVTFKSFEGCKQMCVRPLQPDQQITSEDSGSPLIYKNYLIGIVTYKRRGNKLGTAVIMRLDKLKNCFPEVILTLIQEDNFPEK